jgi:hypothetical protein
MPVRKHFLIGALALLAGPALAQGANPSAQMRDLTVEQNTAAQAVSPKPGSLAIQISADRPDATYAVGETVRLTINSNEEAYVTVLDVGPTGQVTQLFPNQYQTDNHVLPGKPVEIAGGTTGARITATGPAGAELIKVIASNKPLAVVSEAQLEGRSAFRSVSGGVKTVVRDLQVVSDQAAAQSDTKVSFSNFALHTIGKRLAAAPGTQTLVVIPGQPAQNLPAPAAAPALITVPAQQPFPLLIAVDKPVYKLGEKPTLAVTSTQACNLTVLEVTASGQVRTLYPNQANSNAAIGANQTVVVAGGASAVQIGASAGIEQIVAICSTDAAPAVAQPADDKALARDLAVVAAHSGGATAMASATFTVQP